MKAPLAIAHSAEDTDSASPTNAVALSNPPTTSGMTLLPRPVASLVSLLTQSTSLSLRVGTFFGGVALDGARATTLTSLELGRAVIEGILTRAGRDVAIRSGDEHGRMEAESLLERSVCPKLASINIGLRDLHTDIDPVGNIAYNSDLGLILRRCHIPLLINNTSISGELLAGSPIDIRCYSRFY